jgi:hypothetical protein
VGSGDLELLPADVEEDLLMDMDAPVGHVLAGWHGSDG